MARIYLSPPHASGRELELVEDAIASNWIAPLGPHVDAFEHEFAAVVGRAACARPVERDRRAPPRARRARHRRRRRGRLLDPHVRRQRQRHPLHRAPPGIRRLRHRDLEHRSRAARRGARRPPALGAACAPSSPSTSTGNAATTTRSLDVCERHGVLLIEDAAEALGARTAGSPAGGQGDVGGVLLQRQQDHHDERRRHARVRRPRPDRPRPAALDPGPRSRAALRALRARASTTG